MGIGKGIGSMSTTTDIIYSHKKFKRTATEAWESKESKHRKEEALQAKSEPALSSEPNYNIPSSQPSECSNYNGRVIEDEKDLPSVDKGAISTCSQCGIVNGKQTSQHVCIHLKEVFCSKCRQVFKTYTKYIDHECLVSTLYNRRSSFEDPNRTCPEIIEKSVKIPKIRLNHSLSLPLDAQQTSYRNEASESNQDNTLSDSIGVKQIYKPKFRAQYSFQGETEKGLAVTNTLSSSAAEKETKVIQSLVITSSSSVPSTYHTSNPSLYTASSQIPNYGSSSATLDTQSHKTEVITPLCRGVTSHYSTIWKGIKSPSPELVGQHITNLIVQNQAIVETHNPLWSIKYKRQSSTGLTSHNESDAGTSHKLCKLNESKGTKLHINSLSSSSCESSSESHREHVSQLSSLPRSYFSQPYSQSSSLVRASKNISNPSLPTSSYICKVNAVDVHNPSLTQLQNSPSSSALKINFSAVPDPSESLDPSNLSRNATNISSLNCKKCGNLFTNYEARNHHLKYGCSQVNLYVLDKSSDRKFYESKKYEEQEVALDLHKKREKSIVAPSLQGSTINESHYKHFVVEENNARGLSISPNNFQSSPPVKKRKLSSNNVFAPEKFSSYSSVSGQNTRSNSTPDYRIGLLDDFGKPKGNINLLYGGEVQICDGKEMKTLKIDSIKNETPSLDLCIASKHLGVDLENNISKVSAPVVVTIAKCGLNCGGTMVKVENQNSNTFSNKVLVNLPCGQSKPSEKIATLSPKASGVVDQTPISFAPPLLQYSQIPLESQGSPNLNLCGSSISLQVLKGSIPSASLVTLYAHPKTASSYDKTGIQVRSPVQYKEQEISATQKFIHPLYPSVISVGDEVVPYVPGIPGPYSQAGIVFKSPSKSSESLTNIEFSSSSSGEPLSQIPVNPSVYSLSNIGGVTSTGANLTTFASLSPLVTPVIQLSDKVKLVDSAADNLSHTFKLSKSPVPPAKPTLKLPEIRIQPPPLETTSVSKNFKLQQEPNRSENEGKTVFSDSENTFLMPRKRPNTLMIKPQTFCLKPSLSLIGSTLVSPDTPRPKKSCAQLFLNGSAYTYLNLKVSTKTFFCCIYRPQPMYVLQSTNPKLSMYSNWQVCKAEKLLNLSPSEAMGLHISGSHCNRAYTIAKEKEVQLTITDSSYWTKKLSKAKSKQMEDNTNSNTNKESKLEIMAEATTKLKGSKEKGMRKETSEEEKKMRKETSEEESGPPPKRIKIFEGGFKTNEEYTYIRGRGRGRYVCESCGIRCKKPSMLKKHIRTHTDLRPFGCKHCSFSFKTKGNLTKHLKSKAHFKRCTEMGIVPVPITVNESHFNQEALQRQEMLDSGNESSQPLEAEDDDDDDEDEDDDDEDDDEEEEEEEDEEEYEEEGEKNVEHSQDLIVKSGMIMQPSSHSDGLSHTLLWMDKGLNSPLDYSKSPSRNLENMPKMPGMVEEGVPIDLSIKRPSVITPSVSLECSKETISRPSQLFWPKTDQLESKKLPGFSSIKEIRGDILSPVTDSSLILKSIYDTTFKVSSSNLEKIRSSDSDLIKDPSCGAMLQTYLTERAVLDLARKRYQYLQSSDDPFLNSSQNTITLATNNSTMSSGSLGLEAKANCHDKEPIIDETKVIQYKGNCQNTKKPITDNPPSTTQISVLPKPEVTNSSSVIISVSGSSGIQTSKSEALVSVSKFQSPNKPGIVIPLTGTSSHSSFGSSSVTSKITPSSTSETRVTSTGRKHSKNSYSSSNYPSLSTANLMLTPPANLTVVNSCSGDSKTTFITPSGIIPSTQSNRMGSDDGKCKCSVCHKEFAKQGQLRLHINIHYIERPHRCESCGISFRTNGHLQKHKRSVSHFNKVNMNMTFGTPSTDNPRPFKCHDCKIAFRIYGHLAKHLRSKLHIMKLECLGKLPFGTYAEIERSGVNLNEIDTSDCENSLESLQVMASKLYEKEPAKLLAWQNQQVQQSNSGSRERTVSSSSTNSEDYSLVDDQESGTPSSASTSKSDELDSGDEDDPAEVKSLQTCSTSNLPPCEVGSGATEGLLGCPKCHQKFLDLKYFEEHYLSEHKAASSKTSEEEQLKSKGKVKSDASRPHGFSSSTEPSVSTL